MTVTAEQFEREYAERSGTTVELLHHYGFRARPCDCDYEKCQGWQMLTDDAWLAQNDFEAWKRKHFPSGD